MLPVVSNEKHTSMFWMGTAGGPLIVPARASAGAASEDAGAAAGAAADAAGAAGASFFASTSIFVAEAGDGSSVALVFLAMGER